MNTYIRHFLSFLFIGVVFFSSATAVNAQQTINDCTTTCNDRVNGCQCNADCDGEVVITFEPFYAGTCREQLQKAQQENENAGNGAWTSLRDCTTTCTNSNGCACMNDACFGGDNIQKRITSGTCGAAFSQTTTNRDRGSQTGTGQTKNESGADKTKSSRTSADDSVFGTVEAPQGVSRFSTGEDGDIGLLNFISVLVRIFTVVMGIVVFFNFIYSGYTYITSDGNSKAAETVRTRLTYSIIGLVLIVSSYMIIALISLIIFGDASYILNPTLTPPGTP